MLELSFFPDHRTRVAAARGARMHHKLVESALLVFAEKGVDASVIEDVIAAADVSRGTFYNYFRTTGELFAAAIQELGNEGRRFPRLRRGVSPDYDFIWMQRDGFRCLRGSARGSARKRSAPKTWSTPTSRSTSQKRSSEGIRREVGGDRARRHRWRRRDDRCQHRPRRRRRRICECDVARACATRPGSSLFRSESGRLLCDAPKAFDHVRRHSPGRAMLIP